MKILHVLLSHLPMPPNKYGGTERVVWSLYNAQKAMGHEVRFLWRKALNLPDKTIIYNSKKPIEAQIDDWPDVVHFHWPYEGELHKPYICTEHGNANFARKYPHNTVFLSRRHADNHNAECYVYNGLEWKEYGEPNLTNAQPYFHFLGKAKAPAKNLAGSIEIALRTGSKLKVLGGSRLNLGRNSYFYPNRSIQFYGMVGGDKKNRLIRDSSGMIFPARWHEPFGLAIIESLYLGVPVLASPYGSLPEIVENEEVGFLSTCYDELADAVLNIKRFDRRSCHELAKNNYSAETMANRYTECYQKVMYGEKLNNERPTSQSSFIELLPIG